MSFTGRIRYPISMGRRHNDRDRCLQIDSVSGRDEDGVDTASRSHHRSNDLTVLQQGTPGPTVRIGRPSPSHEATFGTAQSRKIEEEPEMTSQAKPAGMSRPLTIDHHQIRFPSNAFKDREKRRKFAEGEKTRHVRKGILFSRCNDLENSAGEFGRGKFHQHGRGEGVRFGAGFRIGDIEAENPQPRERAARSGIRTTGAPWRRSEKPFYPMAEPFRRPENEA